MISYNLISKHSLQQLGLKPKQPLCLEIEGYDVEKLTASIAETYLSNYRLENAFLKLIIKD